METPMTYIDPELSAEEMEIEYEAEMKAALDHAFRAEEISELRRIRARREEAARRAEIVAQTETYHKLQAILNPRRNSRKDW
jgi:hypothetical protein